MGAVIVFRSLAVLLVSTSRDMECYLVHIVFQVAPDDTADWKTALVLLHENLRSESSLSV